MNPTINGGIALVLCTALGAGESGSPPLDGFESKVHMTSVEGHTGRALHLSFEEAWPGQVLVSSVQGTADWDTADGISLWVKGDGSANFGDLSLTWGGNWKVAYHAVFPLDSTEWRKITLPWRELTPFIPSPDMRPLDAKTGNAPSQLGQLRFGRMWFLRSFPAHSFAIDDLRLEPKIELDRTDYTPVGPPLARVQALIKAGKPLTWVAMGDSLTDFRHRANQGVNWPNLTIDGLKKAGSDVTLINAGVGGSQLVHGLISMPIWLRTTPNPDLVTILFGGNDLADGITPAQFEQWLGIAIDRVRRATKGTTDVLILTTCPTAGQWHEPGRDDLAGVCRRVAQAKNVGLADIATAIRLAGKDNPEALFFEDHTHLGPKAHRIIADTVGAVLTGR